jgi:hypothetical protein
VSGWYCPTNSCLRRVSSGSDPTDFECFFEELTGHQCGGGFQNSEVPCSCDGQVKRGIYESDSWTAYQSMTGTIACVDSDFSEDPAQNMDKLCYCEPTAFPIAGTPGTAAVSLQQSSGLEQVTCIVEAVCASWTEESTVATANAVTSVEGMTRLLFKTVYNTAFQTASLSMSPIIDGTYTYAPVTTSLNLRMTPTNTADLPTLLDVLATMDVASSFTSLLNMMAGQASGAQAQSLGAFAQLVNVIDCPTSAPTPAPEPESSASVVRVARLSMSLVLGAGLVLALRL